jgi:hypothetical protein
LASFFGFMSRTFTLDFFDFAGLFAIVASSRQTHDRYTATAFVAILFWPPSCLPLARYSIFAMRPPFASFFGFMSRTFTLAFFGFALFFAAIACPPLSYRSLRAIPPLASFFGFMSRTFTLAFFACPLFFAAMTFLPPIVTGPSGAQDHLWRLSSVSCRAP